MSGSTNEWRIELPDSLKDFFQKKRNTVVENSLSVIYYYFLNDSKIYGHIFVISLNNL